MMPNDRSSPTGEITGFFISFDEKEMSDIRRRLELFGYKPDGDGLKKLVKDCLVNMEAGEEGPEFESPTDRVIGQFQDFLEQNPATVAMGLQALKGLAGRFQKKKQ